MAIQYIGRLGGEEKQVNPYMAQLSSQLLQLGSNMMLQDRELAGKERLQQQKMESDAKVTLAKHGLEQADKTRNNLTATWQSLSDKSENERKLFLESDAGREYLKVTKKYVPEVFDDNGSPIFFPSTKDTIKQEIDQQINTVKNKLLTEGPESLTAGESSILQMEGFKDLAAEAMAILAKNPEFGFLARSEDPKDLEMAQKMVTNTVNMLKSQRGMGGGSNVNELSGALYPQQESVSNLPKELPKNVRFKVKEIK